VTIHIDLPQDEIAAFCERWNVSELALFGSVLRADFRPDSDIDMLVAFKPNTRQTLANLLAMEEELESILGRKVDLGERVSVEEDPNYLRRQQILDSTQVIYADR
jgi:predicted nucleotidyltransferase